MKRRSCCVLLGWLLLMTLATVARAADAWKPVAGQLLTPWAEKVDPQNPWSEYPRPQLQRAGWTNLNGLWDYAITPQDAARPARFEGQILVPFAVESALSGVKRTVQPDQRLWYRRAFAAPADAAGKRVLLHFEAVDWETRAWINGRELVTHRGGYDPFSYDITEALQPGQNELLLSVWDPTEKGPQARGKQQLSAVAKPGGIMYTPCTGIWQTVWLEVVPAAHIKHLAIVPDIDAGLVKVSVQCAGTTAAHGVTLTAYPRGSGKAREDKDLPAAIAQATGKPGDALELKIPNAKLWSPDAPYLYNLVISLAEGNTAVDKVQSYFGMRKISIAPDAQGVPRLMLNNKFVFQSGPLDQGFWPDGIYTAPTDEALRFDVEVTKKLGFNMTRKHVKVEPRRWYYWCDVLGLLVWQDMPSSHVGRGGNKEKEGTPVDAEAAKQFEKELEALIENRQTHPSIIMWVVFNEGWGQYDTPRLTDWVKRRDPSRLVSNASGWHDRPVGDIMDMHSYPGPNSPPVESRRAIVLGEFGGLGLAVEGHTWVDKSWGYRQIASARALQRRYLELWRQTFELRDQKGLNAAVYTQLTDCETECNGLLTYDRRVTKVDAAVVHAALTEGKFPPTPQYRVLAPTAFDQPVVWRYSFQKPAADWNQPGFDATNWTEGLCGFGTQGTPGTFVRTTWKTPDIWLRRVVRLPDRPLVNPTFVLHHDEDAEIFINGKLALKIGGYSTAYEHHELSAEAQQLLKPGENVIAIHCHQVKGGQYIDLGLVEETTK